MWYNKNWKRRPLIPCSIERGVFGCAKSFTMLPVRCQYHAAMNQQNVPLIGANFSTHPIDKYIVIWYDLYIKKHLTFHIDCMMSYPSTSCQTPADEWGFFIENPILDCDNSRTICLWVSHSCPMPCAMLLACHCIPCLSAARRWQCRRSYSSLCTTKKAVHCGRLLLYPLFHLFSLIRTHRSR